MRNQLAHGLRTLARGPETEDGPPRKRGSKGFTLIELMVVLLIIGILMAIAIPTYLTERGKADNTAAQTTVRNALTALNADYASQNAYVVPPGDTGTYSTLAAYMASSEPSLAWTEAKPVSAINSVSIAELDSVNSGSGTSSPQAVEVVAWSPSGKCWEALQVEMGSGSWNPGTYYNVVPPTSGACSASTTMPSSTSGWGADWSAAGQNSGSTTATT